MRFWREKAQLFAEPWKSVGENIPNDLKLEADPMSIWKPDMDWSTSSPLWPHVTLAGDAAHNFPPFRGQGLNQAFADVEKLIEELVGVRKGEKGLREAVGAYEEEMKKRSCQEAEYSLMQGRIIHDFDNLMQAPMIKQGMHRYREEMKAKGREVEVATDERV